MAYVQIPLTMVEQFKMDKSNHASLIGSLSTKYPEYENDILSRRGYLFC